LVTVDCTCDKVAESVAAEPTPSPVNLKDAIGMLAVTVVCPSFVITVERPVARSAVKALNVVDEMTVPATTG
jgi:hypothetical protein